MKVFIDGKEGTTGLRIYERLNKREDIELIVLSDDKRKDINSRKEALCSADVAFLCLPDSAAEEAVNLVDNPDTVIIDASTAHRTQPGWAYGFPELSAEHEKKIAHSKRIAVPGCHAGGFIALVYPLIEAGLIPKSVLLNCFSLTGYSGGGKKMITEYESEERNPLLNTPRQYALSQQHKHLKEMQYVSGVDVPPIFCPVVSDFYSGMEVTVPLFKEQLENSATVCDIKEVYRKKYNGPIVSFSDCTGSDGFLAAGTLSKKDGMIISVHGNDERIVLSAVYDNLGKGASGAAIECLNIVTGKDKTFGLDL